MVIVCINYNGLKSSMQHTKFQGHRHFGSGEEIFKGFYIYEPGSHLGHVT